MPELPEVETVVRGIRDTLVGRTIGAIWTDWPKIIAMPSLELFAAQIHGQRIQALGRRGKYIIIYLSHDMLIIHLKMSGRLYVAADDITHDADRWLHFRAQLDNGQQLRFSDARKFGRVYLTNDLSAVIHNMGPEPLEESFTLDIFQERLDKRGKAIKALLLDQSFIAGVGNIYADEALHRAGIHPQRRSNSLSPEESERLYKMIRTVLQDGVDYEGASINWYRKPDGTRGTSQNHFYVYDRAGKPCQRCGTPIIKTRIANRGTHFCPNCQQL